MSDLIGNPEDRFSRVSAHLMVNTAERTLKDNALLHEFVTSGKRVQVGNDQKRRNQNEIPTPKTEVGKTKLTTRYMYLYLENVS